MTYGALTPTCSYCHLRAEFTVHIPGPALPDPAACALHLGDVLHDDRRENAAVTEWKVAVVP